ncbi:MAG: zinc ribbon domain-containing protein [Anaerolineaceae bacterium]
MPQTPLTSAPPVQGIAGYVSPYPYLDRLQDKMEERLAHRVPPAGRFCGFCYARLRGTDTVCPYCQTPTNERATVGEIPQEVLKAYKAKQRTEATWVYMGAFVGLIIASIAFVWLELWGPGILGHPATGFAVLIGGGYLLAQLTGPLIGGQYGYRNGARKRDALWAEFLQQRDA